MVRRARFSTHRGERGISLTIVVIVIFALLGIAALAIDLATLYVARTQAQRIADSAALAGAKTLVERGVTADPVDSQGSWAGTCFQAMAQAQRIGNRGRIGGVAPATITTCYNGGVCGGGCPSPGAVGTGFGVNPQVAVTVRSIPLPLFFSKIWGQRTASVSATGQAEGFNPSGTNVPVASKCVTPWLLPNIDPNGGGQIFMPSNGQTVNNEPTTPGDLEGPVGRTIPLTTGCPGGCGVGVNPPVAGPPLSYYPIDIPNPSPSGPSCSVGVSYQQNITACNPTPIACGQTVNLDTTPGPADAPSNQLALQCRIGAAAPGLGSGQDTLVTSGFPFAINAGSSHNGVGPGTEISTSRSIVTIPVYESGPGGGPYTKPVSPVIVIGFVQAFVNSATGGDPTITILNVSGCSTAARTPGLTPVGLDEGSPVPVRLIHP